MKTINRMVLTILTPAGLAPMGAPYRKDNINRFGAYFLDELREKMTIDFGLSVLSLSY